MEILPQNSLAEYLSANTNKNTESASANKVLQELEKSVILDNFIKNDQPMQDSSTDLLLLLSGGLAGKGLADLVAYSNPVTNTAARLVNSVKEGSLRSLAGLPKLEHLKQFGKSKEATDKVLWTGTGNGLKANAWVEANSK